MKMIDNARAAWKHYSTQALATITGIGTIWAGLPDWVKSTLPSWVAQAVAWTVAGVAIFGLAGKFVDQSKPAETKKDDQQ